jgi:hypothetical protein
MNIYSMKYHIPSNILICLLVIIPIITGCLDSDFEEQSTLFSLTLTLPDANDWHVTEAGDSLRILNFKMVVDSIEVIKQGLENDIFEPDPRFVAISTSGFMDGASIGTGGLTGGRYEGVEFTVLPPPMETQIEDEHLVVRNDFGEVLSTYSLAVTGIAQIDGEVISFTFRSDRTERVLHGFMQPVEMPETMGTLQVELRGLWYDWFLDPNDSTRLLDPNDEASRPHIEQSIIHQFEAVTSDVGGSIQ